MEKTVAIYTLGCKTNQYESNAIVQKFLENGYKLVDFEEKADVYIVNTCTVTNISDRKSRQILRRAKQKNKDSILVVIRMLCTSCQKNFRRNRRNRYIAWKQREKRYIKIYRRI